MVRRSFCAVSDETFSRSLATIVVVDEQSIRKGSLRGAWSVGWNVISLHSVTYPAVLCITFYCTFTRRCGMSQVVKSGQTIGRQDDGMAYNGRSVPNDQHLRYHNEYL